MIFNLILNHSGSSAPSSYTPPTWAGGTDAEIVEALEKHYNGEIDLTEHWSVGDERTISLSAMSATGVGESHAAQNVTMVIMNVGGKYLLDGTTECAFIVGQKACLSETGYMHSSSSDVAWHNCARRTWCNEVYYASIPSTIRPIFQPHLNITGTAGSTATTTAMDYFALPAEKEILGSNSYANSTAEKRLSQFSYYATSSNRSKGVSYYTRSRRSSSSSYRFVYFSNSQSAMSYSSMNTARGIAPFGVI